MGNTEAQIDIGVVHAWLNAGNDPETLIDWVELWKQENPNWLYWGEGVEDEDEEDEGGISNEAAEDRIR